MMRMPGPSHSVRRDFARDESGGITVFGLFLFVACCGLAGLALDVSHAFLTRTRLQLAADGAAHAALVARQTQTEVASTQVALDVVERSLPAAMYGEIVTVDDVVFGEWDEATRAFVAVAGSKDAVMVDTARLAARGNPVGAFLLRFVGHNSFSVLRRSIAVSYEPSCMLEGFVGEEYVSITSGNLFTSGFCVHGNQYVDMSSGNTFEEGAIVSMPDRNDLEIPASGMVSNEGLAEALRDSYYDIDAAERVATMEAGLVDPTSPLFPDYLVTHVPLVRAHNDTLDETTWVPGHIHTVQCNSPNQQVRIPNGTVLREGVLITNCKVSFGSGAAVEDVAVVTTSPAADSINGAAGIRMGVDDDCAPGGGAEFYTLGGMRVPASFRIHGSRVIAKGPVSFVADTGGVQGALVVSDRYVEATAGGAIGFCGVEGLPDWYKQRYYRIVF
jgi:Flp pilus assembly protein TadG